MTVEAGDTATDHGGTVGDPFADAAVWLDEDRATIAALTRGVEDNLLPERERRRGRSRGRAYAYVSRGRS